MRIGSSQIKDMLLLVSLASNWFYKCKVFGKCLLVKKLSKILKLLSKSWMVSKELQLFFLSEISIYLSSSFLLYQRFPNGLKPRRVSDFTIIWSWNRQESEGKETKKHDLRESFFHFQTFETFGNLQIDFGINLNKCVW